MQYKKLRRAAQAIGLLVLVVLVIGCGFITANFMGIRHQSRQDEIQIARMLGAQRGFILAPFVWEGIIEGILGAMAALFLLYVGNVFSPSF